MQDIISRISTDTIARTIVSQARAGCERCVHLFDSSYINEAWFPVCGHASLIDRLKYSSENVSSPFNRNSPLPKR